MTGALVEGVVLGPDSRPVEGATVLFDAAPVPVPDVALLTGPDGRFVLSTPTAGSYGVAVHAPGYGAQRRDVDVRPGTTTVLTIVVGRDAAG